MNSKSVLLQFLDFAGKRAASACSVFGVYERSYPASIYHFAEQPTLPPHDASILPLIASHKVIPMSTYIVPFNAIFTPEKHHTLVGYLADASLPASVQQTLAKGLQRSVSIPAFEAEHVVVGRCRAASHTVLHVKAALKYHIECMDMPMKGGPECTIRGENGEKVVFVPEPRVMLQLGNILEPDPSSQI